MAPRSKRDRASIANLASAKATKRRKLSLTDVHTTGADCEQMATDGAQDVAFNAIWTMASTQTAIVAERLSQTLVEITAPVWTSHVPEASPVPGPQSEDISQASQTGLDVLSDAKENMPAGCFSRPPSVQDAYAAWEDMKRLLNTRRKVSHEKKSVKDGLRRRMEQMRMMLYIYSQGGKSWLGASVQVANSFEKGSYKAQELRRWARAFIADRHALPMRKVPDSSRLGSSCLLEREPDFKVALSEHLQSIGKYVRALDIVEFTQAPDVLERYGLKRPISLTTAQDWMHRLNYRWTRTPSGQFVDGHEREDVVEYRNKVFLPALQQYDLLTRKYTFDGEEILNLDMLHPSRQHVVFWYHDESTFYTNDRRQIRWVSKSEKAIPRAKGEGPSLMIADFVSAEYGFLRSPDGKQSARVIFRAGKNRDGYFTYEDIEQQVDLAMDILKQHFPHDRHIFIFDNARTHMKRAADALSARRMSMYPTKEGNPMFGVDTIVIRDGKETKSRVRMSDGKLPDGTVQPIYFSEGHEKAGVFKGMAIILKERHINTAGLLAQCTGFKCQPPALSCCCRRILYNQPDFRDVETLLQARCRVRDFQVIYLPKFHCELNPIEQCWGFAKKEYRMFPASSKESDLEPNVLAAMDTVTLVSIRRYFNRTHRFSDAYRRGLSGKQAAWAAKKYHGHRTLPYWILLQLQWDNVSRD